MWVEITEAEHLVTVIDGETLAAYRAAVLQEGQADPVQPTIDQVTDLVRGYVSGCSRNVLGEGNTIPSRLLKPFLDIWVVTFLKRVRKSVTAAQNEARTDAIKLLEQVAACKFGIEEPSTAAPEQSSSPSPKSNARVLKFSQEAQDGI